MAFTTLLVTVSMAAIANAGWPMWSNNDDNPFQGFVAPMVPSLRFGSKSSIPNFGQNFPFFTFPTFPTMPTMTFPSIPSPADIANVKPGKGGSFTGVVITSKTQSKTKEDGSVVKETGSTILMNNDGVITVKKTGNAPDISTDTHPTTIAPHNPFHFEHYGIRHLIPIIDPKTIEGYVPGPNENYKGSSIRSSAYSSNINGNVKQGGRFEMVENDNGHVKKEHHTFGTPP